MNLKIKNKQRSIPKLIEVVFNTTYLIIVMVIGIYLLINGKGEVQRLFGTMALVLGGDDC